MTDPFHGRLALVGDVMLRARLSDRYQDGASQFQAIVRALHGYDLVIANLEMPLSRRGKRMPKWSNLRSDPEVIHDVRAMGVDAVTLANNHMLDYGPEAMFDTITACEGAGIACCGVGGSLDEALQPAWLEAGGSRIALLSVSCTLPNASEATPDKPGMAPIRVGFSFETEPNLMMEQPGTVPVVHSWTRSEDQEIVCQRIGELKREADLVIVGIHWGVPEYWLSPYQGLLAEYQQSLGHALVDAGADVVCGHHSHTLHLIEVYQGKPIFYSLGNFLFERPRDFMEPASVIVEVGLADSPTIGLVPVLLDEQGFPVRADPDGATRVLEKLTRLSEPFGTRLDVDGERATLRLD